MIQFLKITILILLSIFLLSCSGGYEPPKHLTRYPQITLKISLSKSEYVEGEPIWLTAMFMNVGEKIDSLADLDEYAVYSRLKIESDSAPTVKYYGPVVDRLCPVYTMIKPDQIYYVLVDVRQFWINQYVSRSLFQGYLLEGKYRIQSMYSSGWSQDEVELQSNNLDFRVIKPSISDSIALDTLLKIFKLKGDQAKMLYDFYKSFGNTVYAEEAFYYYTVRRRLDYNKIKIDSTFLNECYNFLDKYPDSYYKCEIFRKSLSAYQIINGKSSENFKYYINLIKTKYPKLIDCVNRLIENDKNLRNAMKWQRLKIEGF